MNRIVYVVTGRQGAGKTGVARALLRDKACTSMVTCAGPHVLTSHFELGALLRLAPPALLVDEVMPLPVARLEELARPFTHDTITADLRGREPVLVATPALAIVTTKVVGSLRDHPFLKEVKVI